jgi:hypothetical protein
MLFSPTLDTTGGLNVAVQQNRLAKGQNGSAKPLPCGAARQRPLGNA